MMQPDDFTLAEYEKMFEIAEDIMKNLDKYSNTAKGKVLATLFFEPSTRTKLSFETAMLRLGGSVIGFSDAQCSSAAKGETVSDTLKIVSSYSDMIAIRHPEANAPQNARFASSVPVVNAGDGGNQHPTQTLTDLLTIKLELHRLSNLTIGFCGDLKNGRTVHSLAQAMSRYPNNKMVFISPKELKVPEYIENELDRLGCPYHSSNSLEKEIGSLDVIYMTRIQGERFTDKTEYERLKDVYVLDRAKMQLAKKDAIVLHPLPRVNEIAVEVDDDERALFFKQAKYGVYARMALIIKLLDLMN